MQKERRRHDLIQATIESISQIGLSQTTLATITERAGVSPSAASFHFRSKDVLLDETLRYLSAEYSDTWRDARDRSGPDPMDRLRAMVAASFDSRVCNHKKISVWYAFWGESRSKTRYQALCGSTDREFSSQVLELCEAICGDRVDSISPSVAAQGIEGMIDGLKDGFGERGNVGFRRYR